MSGTGILVLTDKIRAMTPVWLRRNIRPIVNIARHIGIGDKDIFLASYPKSGNTWLKFILSELMSGQSIDFASCEKVIPHVGSHFSGLRLPNGARVIKTHEKYREDYRKAIYIVRDGRDVAVSYYYQWMNNQKIGDECSFRDFLEKFLKGEIGNVGPWHESVNSWIRAGDQCDLMIIKYEDCLLNILEIIHNLVTFIGLDVSEAKVMCSIEMNSKDRMRRKEITGGGDIIKTAFVRKGVSSDWINHFTNEDNELFLSYAENTLTALEYPIHKPICN